MAAVVAIAVSHVLISRTVSNSHRYEAENAARIWAMILASSSTREDLLAVRPGEMPPSLLVLRDAMRSQNVTRIKIFDPSGKFLLATDGTELQSTDQAEAVNPRAAGAASSGVTFSRSSWSTDPSAPRTFSSSAYAPVLKHGKVVGVLEVYLDQTANALAHQKGALFLSMAIGLIVLAAIGLPALFLLNKTRSIARAERERQTQSTRFEATVESIPHGFVMFDRENRLIVCNRRYKRMYQLPDHLCAPGTPLHDMVRYGVKIGTLRGPVAKKQGYEMQLDGPEATLDRTWDLADGRIMSVSASGMVDGGRLSIHTDITEQHRAAARIAESEARFRDYAATAADWCWETDAEHRFTLLTEGFRHATGIDPATLLGKLRQDCAYHPEDSEAVAVNHMILATQQPFRDFFVRLVKPTGGHVCVRSSGAPRFAEDGTFLGYRGTARDVTLEEVQKAELKNAEIELRKRTQLLEEAQRLGKLGNITYFFGSPHQHWSAEVYSIMRVVPNGGLMPMSYIADRCLGDGAQRYFASLRMSRDDAPPSTIDIKIRCDDGTIVDCAITTKAIQDASGTKIGFSAVLQDISDRKRAEEQLERIAFYDQLTGLPNRTLFARELDGLIEERNQNHAALLLLDLDRFKEVNDSLGHASGDELLSKVSAMIAATLRPEHLLARIGGDEFAIIVKQSGGHDDVKAIAVSVIDAVSGPILLTQGEVTVGTSIGIAFSNASTNASNLFREADLALYKAKEAGRGRFEFFRKDMDGELQHKIRLERDLKRALSEDFGLELHYQPLADLKSGTISGFEALLRWKHPDLGPIPPAQFIPIAESSRLIIDLGRWVLQEATRQTKSWIDAGHEPREISVNVSAAQLWHGDLVDDVAEILAATGLPPEYLCLELTESLLADPSEQRVRSEIGRLKALGVKLALDDFGTDYSSLGYLTQLPFDKLKIDRVFVDGVATSDRRRELLKGIIALGHGLGMTVVGEGAERTEEIEILTLLGCDVAQGYVISRPLPSVQAMAATTNFKLPVRENRVHAMQNLLLVEAS